MQYAEVIRKNIDAIMRNTCGLFSTEKIKQGTAICGFPTMILQTDKGQRFDVVGILQIDDPFGKPILQDFLVFVPNLQNKTMTKYVVSIGEGVVRDKAQVDATMMIFARHAKMFERKYGTAPACARFLPDV